MARPTRRRPPTVAEILGHSMKLRIPWIPEILDPAEFPILQSVEDESLTVADSPLSSAELIRRSEKRVRLREARERAERAAWAAKQRRREARRPAAVREAERRAAVYADPRTPWEPPPTFRYPVPPPGRPGLQGLDMETIRRALDGESHLLWGYHDLPSCWWCTAYTLVRHLPHVIEH